MHWVIMQKGKRYTSRPLLLRALSALLITSMIIPLVFADVCCSIYHALYFRLHGIPLVPRSQYIVIDRHRLKKLNWIQRWTCVYCDYANGMVAWLKTVINTTEVYSCAIKHASAAKGQEHQKEYSEYAEYR